MKNGVNSAGGVAGANITQRWLAAPMAVLVLGILSLGLFIWVEKIDDRQRANFTLTKALMALQIKAATAHVWLEEAITEKDETRMVRAFATLDWAERLSRMILNGGVPVEGVILLPLGEEKLRQQAEDITRVVAEYKTIAEERRNNPEAGMGSPLDLRFDKSHDAIIQRTAALENDVEKIQLADRKKVGRLFFGILLAWSAIVIAATAGIWNRERRRRDAGVALMKANEELLSQAEELRVHREHLAELVAARTVALTTANERLRSEIAGREQMEKALQASEKQLRHLTARLMTAQEEERWRIANELHDDLGHALTIVKLRLRSVERSLQDKGALGDAEELTQYVDQVIEKVRRLSRELSPSILHVLGLTEALRQLIDNFCRNFDCLGTPDLEDIGRLFPEDAQIMIYRVVQEALTNIGKHARAGKVSVTVRKNTDRVSFVIEDDGQGFNPALASLKAPDGKGLGLATMEERVTILRGKLDVQSEEGRGTRIAFDIPIPEAGHD